MKKTNYEIYQEFVKETKERLSNTSLIQTMQWSSKIELLYGRLIIEVYNRFIKEEWEEWR